MKKSKYIQPSANTTAARLDAAAKAMGFADWGEVEEKAIRNEIRIIPADPGHEYARRIGLVGPQILTESQAKDMAAELEAYERNYP